VFLLVLKNSIICLPALLTGIWFALIFNLLKIILIQLFLGWIYKWMSNNRFFNRDEYLGYFYVYKIVLMYTLPDILFKGTLIGV